MAMNLIREGLNSYGTKLTVAGWLAFGATHLGLSSEPIRPKLIKYFGTEQKYRVFYSAVSLGILAPFAYRYKTMTPLERGPILLDRYKRASWWKFNSAFLRVFGSIFIADAFMTPIKNPFGINSYLQSIEPVDIKEQNRKWNPYGFQRITRHPLFFGLSLYAFGSAMVARRCMCDLILWGGVPLFSLLGIYHQEKRIRPGKPQHYFDETSILPFGAMITGKQRLSQVFSEIPPSAYSAGFIVMGGCFFFF